VQRCVLDARLSADGSALVAMSQGRTADCGYELNHVQLRTGVSTPIGCGTDPAVSGNGDVVAYKTKAVDGGLDAIWAFDVRARSRERVDVADDGTPSNGWAGLPASGPALSHDGTIVAFASQATNLMPGDWSGGDIFIRDRAAGTTRNATVTAEGIPGNGSSFDPSLSGDGTMLAFTSAATDLVPPDENLVSDVFVRRLEPSDCAAATDPVVGTPGDDRLVGTPGRDVIVGLGGDDVVLGRGGDDLVCGGGGSDTASYAGSPAPVHVDLGLGTAAGQGADRLVMVEGVEGSGLSDRLVGSAGPDRFRGLSGFDVVNGLGGDDVMDGGNGNDRLYGGLGRDALVGGAGNDLLSGGGDADSVDGGDGTDSCGGDRLDAPVVGCEG
jgi:Ca2+-binding RTX toxin-like protein